MADPIVDTQWGKADWIDYEHNWREKDAEYLQARSILRFQNAAARDAALSPPSVGMVVFNDATDRLEWRSKTNAWLPLNPIPANLAVAQDTTTAVSLAHSAAAGKGLIFTPADIKITGPVDVLSGVVKLDGTGLTLKVGAATALLSTDATALVSSLPVKAPSLSLTGTGTVLDASGKTIVVGTLNASQLGVTNLGVTGTLTGGVLNGTSGTIGGVALASSKVVSSGGFGFTGATTALVGDANKATLQASGKAGKVEVDDNVALAGTLVNLNADMAVRNKAINWYDSGNTQRGQYAVSIYSATDPGAANFPNGAIWFS